VELSQAQEDDLRRVLKQNPSGISTESLSHKVNSFVDRQELALGLHSAKQQGWLYKKDGLHFLVNSEVTKEYEESLVKTDAPIAGVSPVAVKVDPWANTRKKAAEAKVDEPVRVGPPLSLETFSVVSLWVLLLWLCTSLGMTFPCAWMKSSN
jgi:hypothetical protein